MDSAILNVFTYLPLLGAAFILFFLSDPKKIRYFATMVAAVDFVVSLFLWWYFDPRVGGDRLFQFRWTRDWIPSLGVKYDFGIDGIALLLILLTTLTGVIAIYSSFSAIDYRQKEYYVLLLLRQIGMLGTFCALDFFLFYDFWEIMLVPMYFIIGIWGGPRKLYAAIKFFLYTLTGSVVMLLSIVALFFFNDGGIPFLNIKGLGNAATFSMLQYHNIGHLIPPTLQFWIFVGFFLGFAIKVPMFPFHTWLPDAHVEAPTAGSIILAAVLLKMGTYGFVRIALPVLPEGTKAWLPWVVGLAIVGIIYERRHTRMIADYGGLAKQMPMYATLFLIAALSSMGLPALNGFIGEFTILLGAANRNIWWAVFAAIGIVLGAAYLLWLYQRVFWGPLDNPANKNIRDLNRRELGLMVALVAVMVWIGIYPKPIFDLIDKPVEYIVQKVDPGYFNNLPATRVAESK